MTTLVSFGARIPRATARTAFASLALVLTLPAVAAAQAAFQAPGEAPYRAPRPGFSLFGNADLAGTGMRVSGGMAWGVSNIGPCADGAVIFNENGCGNFIGQGSSTFEVVLAAGAPIHDFRKIRTVHPGVNGHLGPQGYTSLSTHLRVGAGSQDWGPADNTLGTMFSGAVSTADGSCQDNSGRPNNFMNTGFTLLAGSDCPPTWAGSFNGPRVLSDSAFIRLQQAQGDDFTFDYWKIPESDRSSTLLGNFSTYGAITDHYAEALTSYGSVTPRGGVARPARQGFPLGLRIHFEAFTFNRPQISNVVFYQMLVINRSEDVYGVGIDYDSLYMGVMNGMLLDGDQGPAMYVEPQRNAYIAVRNGVNTGCNDFTPGITGPYWTTCQNQGFDNSHAYANIMLKSPIGDTRNKLLTRPGAFYNPTSRFADDTITFNHHHACGFGASCFSSTIGTNDRRAFGHISSTEVNTLDGRDPASLTQAVQWGTFRPKAHPAQPNARYNRYVPGTWSYENKPFRDANPGAQDTIFADECEGTGFITRDGQTLPSCSVTYSDTMPGKQNNAGPANVGNYFGAGPFPLKAGDTTSFVLAWVVERDSAGFEAMINATIDAYLNYYLGPDAPPVPSIVSVEVASAEERFAVDEDPFIRLTFTDEPETFVDPFFARYASDLRTSTDPFFARLRQFNPGLADEVEAIAQNNFSELWIFKSCDGGTTYTNDTDCAGDPTIGPRGTLGLGWQPYAILTADANGNIPNTFLDESVIPGVTYLYSLVTRSRGLTLAINDVDPATCPPPFTAAECVPFQTILTIADTASSTILSSGPSTANVYVPISLPAGGQAATFTATNVRGNATVPIEVNVAANARAGDYRLIFGNRFIINEVTDLTTGNITTTVQVQEIVPSAFVSGPDTTATDFIVRETVLSTAGTIDFAGFTYAPSDTTIGTTRLRRQVVTLTAPAVGFVAAQGTRPLFISTNVTNSGTTLTTPEAFTARPDFPGFRIALTQSDTSVLKFERLLRPNGDSIAQILLNANAVQYRQESSTRRQGRGTYEIRYEDDPFGPGAPFNPRGTLGQVGPQVLASLADREVAAIGDTSAAIRALLTTANSPSGYGAALRPIRFPFTVAAASGNPTILAAPRRQIATGAPTNTLLIGNGADTLRVPVDSLDWLPGDPFVVFEVVTRDSLVGGRVAVNAAGERLTQTDTVVAFAPIVLGCNTPRERCNPAAFPGPGGTGYLPVADGWKLVFNYPMPFTPQSEVALRIEGLGQSVGFARSDLNKIRVVPNPYVVQSLYDEIGANRRADPRLMFSGVPTSGSIRIYSVSGQFLQQIDWQPGDLEGGSGDLPWNLRTREGTQVAGGIYIYVLTANDAEGKKVNARGKFVVIR